jgi:hypothetical protein
LDDLAADVEFGAFFDKGAGFFAEFFFPDGLRCVAGLEEGAGRELEAADVFGLASARLWMAISELGCGVEAGVDSNLPMGWVFCGSGFVVSRVSKARPFDMLRAGSPATGWVGLGCMGITLDETGGGAAARSQMLSFCAGAATGISSPDESKRARW